MGDDGLFIGKVAARTGLNPKTIRYYEAIGLLPEPRRGANRYRLYPGEVVELLQFIKKAQGLGFTLAEIREIVAIRRRGDLPCGHVRTLVEEKIEELDRKMTDLQMVRDRLQALLRNWNRKARGGKAGICPHIEGAPLIPKREE